MKLSEMEEEIRHRETAVQSMDAEIRRLQTGISEMSHELDAKGREILKVRSEAHIAVRLVTSDSIIFLRFFFFFKSESIQFYYN